MMNGCTVRTASLISLWRLHVRQSLSPTNKLTSKSSEMPVRAAAHRQMKPKLLGDDHGHHRTAAVLGHHYRHDHVCGAGGEAVRTHADFITAVAIAALIMLALIVG